MPSLFLYWRSLSGELAQDRPIIGRVGREWVELCICVKGEAAGERLLGCDGLRYYRSATLAPYPPAAVDFGINVEPVLVLVFVIG